MIRNRSGAFAALLATALLVLASPAMAQTPAQTPPSARAVRAAPVFDDARGDSVRVGAVQAGDMLEVVDRQGNWVLVVPPPDGTATWRRGWIHVTALELVSGELPGERKAAAKGRFMVRGFGHAGGSLFTARDSFDAIAGSPFGLVVGGGGQVVFPNGLFAQVSVDRLEETGSRVLVSGTQLFTLDVDNTITLLPVQATIGYRAPSAGALSTYLGGGVGWYRLTEESSSPSDQRVSDSFIGYHVLGGVELGLARWAALAGEAQWTAVPNALGDSGISAIYGEDDLGGTTFRVKIIVGF